MEGIPMSKDKQKIIMKDKYASDNMMRRLLACHHNIECINNTLERYGSTDLTLEEIGLVLGITKERVRQIENSALKKLRNPNIGRILRDYMMM